MTGMAVFMIMLKYEKLHLAEFHQSACQQLPTCDAVYARELEWGAPSPSDATQTSIVRALWLFVNCQRTFGNSAQFRKSKLEEFWQLCPNYILFHFALCYTSAAISWVAEFRTNSIWVLELTLFTVMCLWQNIWEQLIRRTWPVSVYEGHTCTDG